MCAPLLEELYTLLEQHLPAAKKSPDSYKLLWCQLPQEVLDVTLQIITEQQLLDKSPREIIEAVIESHIYDYKIEVDNSGMTFTKSQDLLKLKSLILEMCIIGNAQTASIRVKNLFPNSKLHALVVEAMRIRKISGLNVLNYTASLIMEALRDCGWIVDNDDLESIKALKKKLCNKGDMFAM